MATFIELGKNWNGIMSYFSEPKKLLTGSAKGKRVLLDHDECWNGLVLFKPGAAIKVDPFLDYTQVSVWASKENGILVPSYLQGLIEKTNPDIGEEYKGLIDLSCYYLRSDWSKLHFISLNYNDSSIPNFVGITHHNSKHTTKFGGQIIWY